MSISTTKRCEGMSIESLKRLAARLLPSAKANLKACGNYKTLKSLLHLDTTRPKVLIVGVGTLGEGLDVLLEDNDIEFTQSDISTESVAEVVCDAHTLPFPNEYFNAVIAQAVLEHVLDPFRCIDEMYRVLKTRGIIYVEIPFLQGVHGGRYDFIRFTDLGIRRLCRRFSEIDRGAMCGTGMALAGMYEGFLKSLTRSRRMRYVLVVFARLTSFWLRYVDYYSIDTPATLDAASGLFFMGRKNNTSLSDSDLLKLYKGASGC